MTAPRCTVFGKRETPAWPGRTTGCEGRVRAAEWAFTTRFASDAHFAQYAHTSGRRLSVDALARLEADGAELPTVDIVAFDIDAHGATPRQLRDWREKFGAQVATLPGAPFGYFTRNGARLVWSLAEPWALTPARAEGWRRAYLRACLLIWKHAGIVCDANCSDWTRLFRVPFATRDGKGQDHGIACGDASKIGTFPRAGWVAGVDEVGPRTFDRLALMSTWQHARKALYPAVAPVLTTNRQYAAIVRDTGAEGALRYATKAILEAGPGERNQRLFAQARWLYAEHVHRGRFDAHRLNDTLRDAAHDAGLDRAETASTLASAWRSANANLFRRELP